jgi:hypothetical protein
MCVGVTRGYMGGRRRGTQRGNSISARAQFKIVLILYDIISIVVLGVH